MKTTTRNSRFLLLKSYSYSRILTLACFASFGTTTACSDDAATSSMDGGSHEGPSNHTNEDDDASSENNGSDDTNETSNPRTDGGADTSDETDPEASEDGGQASDDTAPASSHDPNVDASNDTSNEPEDTSDSPEDPPSEQQAKARFFLPTPEVDNTGAPHLKLDKAGGLHAAYPTYVGKGAYYAYCDADCASEDDVSVVRFETELTVLNALIDLTEDGRPRVLLSSWDRIYYAECDENCTNQESWKLGAILKHDNKKEITGEAFALDPDGNPAFLLHSYVELWGVSAEAPATHFAWCSSDCTNNGSWIANKLADENWEGGALRFDEQGGAHVFAAKVTYDLGVPQDRIPVYSTCASHCEDPTAAWNTLALNYSAYEDRDKAVSIRPELALELTSDGAPRALAMLKGEGEDERWVSYLACDQGCTESNEAWAGTVVSNNANLAAGLDLALDKTDRPRIVYNLGYSIFYAACDNDECAVKPQAWDISPVELVAEMDPDEIILWPNCNVDAWFLHSPNLVLDAHGEARVGYQAADMSGGGVPEPDPHTTPCRAGLDMTWTRLSKF